MAASNVHVKRGQVLAIESLRLIIALWVVYCHHYANQEQVENSFFRNLIYNNQGSVFAFVVLSGFMTHWTSRDIEFNSLEVVTSYMKRRYSRIYAAYALAVIFACIMRMPGVTFTHVTTKEHAFNTVIVALGLQSWFTWTEMGVYDGPAFSLAAPFWTISALWFAWAVYPLFSRFFIHRGSVSVAFRDTLLIFAIGCMHRFLRPGHEGQPCSGWGPYQGWWWFPPNCLGMFLLGAYGAELAASLYPYRETIRSSPVTAISIDVLFVIYLVLNGTNWDVQMGLPRDLDCFSRTVPVLIGCILATQQESLIFGSKLFFPLQQGAKYALAVYVFQTPFAQLYLGITHGFPMEQWPHFPSPHEFIPYLSCLFIVCMLYFHLIEEKFFARSTAAKKGVETTRDYITYSTIPAGEVDV